jgi:tRNA 2-thiouridine synthesizing protein A
MRTSMTNVGADRELDIRGEICPMTFVRTRLALDRMAPGETLLVILGIGEPSRNVPITARSLGHEVLDVSTAADGCACVLIRRGSGG